MTRFLNKLSLRLPALVAGAFFVGLALQTLPVQAQSNDNRQLLQRLNQLENQIQTLSRAVYRGEKMPVMPTAPAGDNGMIAAFEERLSAVEAQQRDITGQVEKALFDLQQIRDQLQRQNMAAPAPAAPSSSTLGGVLKPGAVVLPVEPAVQSDIKPSTFSQSTPADVYDNAFADVRAARYLEAEAKLTDFMTKYPAHPLAANAQYWLGETYYAREKFADAARTFAQGYQNYPKSSKAADSLMKLGLSLDKLGKKQDACLTFSQLAKEYPGERTPAARRAAQEAKRLGCS
jgi:tol-pal system protein YbgF